MWKRLHVVLALASTHAASMDVEELDREVLRRLNAADIELRRYVPYVKPGDTRVA